MRKIILTSILACFFTIAHSQVDTLYTKKDQKIPCKITEITESDIKYKRANLPDGPVYVIAKASVIKYSLSNGHTEIIETDELSIENEHGNILKNRSVIKINPFSPVNDQISMAYEKVIKVGMNLDIELGYSNSNIVKGDDFTGGGILNNAFNSGFYVKPGVKFFLGQDYSVKGLKYAHPLKGRYIRLDLAFSYSNYQDVKRIETIRSQTSPFTYTNVTVSTDISTFAYGGFVNYGRQFILANVITLEYYVGVGFTGQSNTYSNPNYKNPASLYGVYYNYNYNYDDARYISNYHGFMRSMSAGLSFTGGFRVGYILPDKSSKEPKKLQVH